MIDADKFILSRQIEERNHTNSVRAHVVNPVMFEMDIVERSSGNDSWTTSCRRWLGKIKPPAALIDYSQRAWIENGFSSARASLDQSSERNAVTGAALDQIVDHAHAFGRSTDSQSSTPLHRGDKEISVERFPAEEPPAFVRENSDRVASDQTIVTGQKNSRRVRSLVAHFDVATANRYVKHDVRFDGAGPRSFDRQFLQRNSAQCAARVAAHLRTFQQHAGAILVRGY